MPISKDQIIKVLTALKNCADGSINDSAISVDDREKCQDLGLTDGNRLTQAGEDFLLANRG